MLSAHIKLLLDAPEHLWRLIEREKYFQAAWLFLLARVVHRALVRNDQDDESWTQHGIDVLVRCEHKLCEDLLTCRPTGAIPLDSATMGDCIPFPYSDHTQGNTITEVV